MFVATAAALALLTATPLPLAALGLRAPPEHASLAESLGDTLALRMTQSGIVRVTTSADVAAVLGLERQRQLLGCSETSCVAELAGALGARALVGGELTRVGALFQLTVKVLDAATAAPLFSALERHADATSLLAAVDRLAVDATRAIGRHFALKEERTNPSPLIGLGVSAALLAGGGVLLGLSAADATALRAQQPTTYEAALSTKNAGELKQGLGIGLVGVGAAAAIGSLVWLAVRPKIDAPLSVALGPTGVTAWGSF